MRILVTGGTGLVGRRLLPRLRERGDEVFVLSRQERPELPVRCMPLVGDPAIPGPWLETLERCDAVVHLAGENVFARRWRQRFKQRLIDSRVQSTRLIAERLARQPRRDDGSPKILISASAVGYYGTHDYEQLDEDDPPGDDFLARLCIDWEKAADTAQQAAVRVVHPRIGMVLDDRGGALPKLVRPMRWFVGGYVGDGHQYISWIHVADLVNLLILALDRPDVTGPINATAPEPLTNWGFGKMLGKVLHRPSWMRIPRLVLRVLLGEVASVVAKGQRVLPQRALRLGFEFQFADLEPALRDLLKKNRSEAQSAPQAPSS